MEEDSLNQLNAADSQAEPQTLVKERANNEDLNEADYAQESPEREADAANRPELAVEEDGGNNEMMDDYNDIHNAADYGDEDEIPLNHSAADINQEELEAIIESISSGKNQQYKKLQF